SVRAAAAPIGDAGGGVVDTAPDGSGAAIGADDPPSTGRVAAGTGALTDGPATGAVASLRTADASPRAATPVCPGSAAAEPEPVEPEPAEPEPAEPEPAEPE